MLANDPSERQEFQTRAGRSGLSPGWLGGIIQMDRRVGMLSELPKRLTAN
jgi:hypothetical protein